MRDLRRIVVASLALASALGCRGLRPEDSAASEERVYRYLVVMQDRGAGVMSTVVRGNGNRETYFSYQDRGRGPRLRLEWALRPDGLPASLLVRGEDEDGNGVEERFTRTDTEVSWKSPFDEGRSKESGGFYVPSIPAPEALALLTQALIVSPGHRLPLLPAGEAKLEKLATVPIEDRVASSITLYAVTGLQFGPSLVWLDSDGVFFASGAPYLAVIRRGHEALLPRLFAVQSEALSQRERELSARLAKPVQTSIALRDVRVVDVKAGVARENQGLLLRDGWIVWIGPDAGFKPPADAVVVEGAGRTLVPGLWDLHVHPESMGELLHLAAGVVAVRDLGSDATEALARRRATQTRSLLGPRLFLAGLIDGPGSLSAPTKVFVRDEPSAIAAVDAFAKARFDSVKVYNLVPPALVPVIAARAHERGLRLSGHVPQGMTAEQALQAGMDEVHHAYFLFPSLLAEAIADRPEPMPVLMREAPWLDLQGEAVQRMVALFRKRNAALDPTLNLCESLYVGRRGAPSAAMAQVLDRLPVLVQRRLLSSGVQTVAPDEARRLKNYLQATVKLTGALYRGGVRLVAGSDGMAGFTLLRELELLQEAGLRPAEVVRIATLGAAEWMGRDRELGSVEKGKRADLLLVDGDPLADVGALRRAAMVFYDGAMLRPSELYEAIAVRPVEVPPVVVRAPGAALSGP